MICYYVIYQDAECDTSVARFDTEGLARDFIKGKMESGNGYELGDFGVIHGKPLNVELKMKPVICLEAQDE